MMGASGSSGRNTLIVLAVGLLVSLVTSRAQNPDCVVTRDIQYGEAAGVPLLMDVVAPDPKPARSVPAIVLLHGGGWAGGDRSNMLSRAELVARHGYVAVTVEYRLAGKAPFPAQLQDSKCAVRFLRAHAAQFGVDPQRIGVWGCSAGGHLASMIGLTENVAGFEGEGGCAGTSSAVQMVVDCFGPSDLLTWQESVNKLARDPVAQRLFGPSWADKNLEWQEHFALQTDPSLVAFLGSNADAAARFASPITYATRKGDVPPFLIVQGTQDGWVPMQQSILLADALDANGVRVTLLLKANMGHDETKVFPEILDFIQKTLPPSD